MLSPLVSVREPAQGEPATSGDFSCCPVEIGQLWLDVGLHVCNPNAWKVGIGGGDQEFEASLGYMAFCGQSAGGIFSTETPFSDNSRLSHIDSLS